MRTTCVFVSIAPCANTNISVRIGRQARHANSANASAIAAVTGSRNRAGGVAPMPARIASSGNAGAMYRNCW